MKTISRKTHFLIYSVTEKNVSSALVGIKQKKKNFIRDYKLFFQVYLIFHQNVLQIQKVTFRKVISQYPQVLSGAAWTINPTLL